MIQECEICGDNHDAEQHGEPVCLYQPSLHTIEEYAAIVVDEAKALGCKVDDLMAELATDGLADDHGQILDAIGRITDKGFCVWEGDDMFAVYHPIT